MLLEARSYLKMSSPEQQTQQNDSDKDSNLDKIIEDNDENDKEQQNGTVDKIKSKVQG